MSVKKSDIDMMCEDGEYQLAVGEHCVTEGDFKSAEACYKSYIVELINCIDRTSKAVSKANTGF